MAKRNKTMSEALKYEIANELGVYNTVKDQGWGSVTSQNCGNMVKKAIQKANGQTANNQSNNNPGL